LSKTRIIPRSWAASGSQRESFGEFSAWFFGPPPLTAGDDQAQYEAMRDQISAVGPLDFLQEIWVNTSSV
jgi:hypothetical protein